MRKNASVKIAGDAAGNVVITGDSNKVTARVNSQFSKEELPNPKAVDIGYELQQIRALLRDAALPESGKVNRALDDAQEEVKRPAPDKDEVGKALTRALDYAKKGGKLAKGLGKLAPHIKSAAAWLGETWYHIIS